MATNGDKVTATTVENGVAENPKKIVDLNTTEPDRIDDDILDGEDEVKGLSESNKVIGSGDVSPVDEVVQKKIRRAERFGVSVKLTEEEKRNSRAERFGTVAAAAAVNGSDGTKKAEELKRKARADRFGVVAASSPTTGNTEEEAKKKARLARFGNDTKADAKVDVKVNSAEEDKRKARALRFSKAASDSSSDLPVKQTIGKNCSTLCFILSFLSGGSCVRKRSLRFLNKVSFIVVVR
ncbi:hypothetical protein AALP_AA8G016600 [Arabis alpina]|uniref:THO1-MOS11 C-terminal domain-containing protein n=1 Tax=Arabis alpina TaxID=50452 RepID=A0A087G4C4_ARAAL|nr:hypothetical protein AALP_AA8G016600 [Arabis alpina]